MKATESIVTGEESAETLRKLILDISQVCPFGKSHDQCPFRIFGLLSVPARNSLIMALSRESCLHFFELEQKCRASGDCAQPPEAR